MCHCEVSDRCQRKSSKRCPCGSGRALALSTTRKCTAPHAISLSLRTRWAHWVWQSVLPCGDNLFGAPHSLYRAGRTESSAPTNHSVGATLAVARPTAFLETIRRGRRLPTVVPTDSRPLSCPPIGALPRNRLASSATGGASPISPTPRLHRPPCPHPAAYTAPTQKDGRPKRPSF